MNTKSNHLLEVCIDTLEDAKLAIDQGADRLEVCSRLDLDGLTPSASLVEDILEYRPDFPLMVMIRSNTPNFIVNKEVANQMLAEIELLKKYNVQGFVVGALNEDKKLDTDLLLQLRKATKGYELTFHRAFDHIIDQKEALDWLINKGYDHVLTSGTPAGCIHSLEELHYISKQAGNAIQIMAGGGVSPENVAAIHQSTSIRHFHASTNYLSNSVANKKEKVRLLTSILVSFE